jgi:hypothetical protein
MVNVAPVPGTVSLPKFRNRELIGCLKLRVTPGAPAITFPAGPGKNLLPRAIPYKFVDSPVKVTLAESTVVTGVAEVACGVGHVGISADCSKLMISADAEAARLPTIAPRTSVCLMTCINLCTITLIAFL